MTTRRFKFTGAVRVRQHDVEIIIDRDGEHLAFDASYNLSAYVLPETAEVVIEAYAEWTLMRFPFGTVGMRHVPDSTLLKEFDDTEGIRFRLKVLGSGDQAGLILAEADKIRPSDLTQREDARSFIVARPADLGDVAWRLIFDEAQPVLQVNSRFGDWQSFLRRSSIRSLLLPEIVRQVLREALDFEGDDEDTDAWQHHALKLAPPSAGDRPKPNDDDDRDRWVDEVVRKFARKHSLLRGINALMAEEGEN